MTTAADLQRQLNEVQRELGELKAESTINVGLLATAIRRSRLGLANLEQEQSVKRIAGPASLIGWDPRQGAFANTNFAQTLADRLKAAASASGGTTGPAAGQTSVILRDALAAYDAVLLTAIQLAELAMGSGTAPYDVRLFRAAVGTFEIDNTAGGRANVWLDGDLVQLLGSHLEITYNGDGTVNTVTRSGAQGAATTTVSWSAGHVTSVVTVRGGKTVTVTPTYVVDDITQIDRAVA